VPESVPAPTVQRCNFTIRRGPGRPIADPVAAARAKLDQLLGRLALGDDVRHRIALATGEAVANGVEHSGRGEGVRVRVELRLAGGELVVQIRDGGAGFDPAAIPDPRAPDRRLARRGRGVLLMRSLSDALDCSVDPCGSCVVTLRWTIDSTATDKERS